MTIATLKRVSRSSLADSVYDSILEAILDGRFAGGAELSEVALAADLGVSRTPVHEALRRLVIDGLVEPMTNRQVRVSRPERGGICEIYEMRLLLEPAAARRATLLLSAAQIEALRSEADLLAATSARPDWPARAIDFDIRFHERLAAACGNGRLCGEITKYRRLVRALCRATGTPDSLHNAFREHLAILEALEARDPAGAARAMEAHIEARRQAVLAITVFDEIKGECDAANEMADRIGGPGRRAGEGSPACR